MYILTKYSLEKCINTCNSQNFFFFCIIRT